MQLLEMKSRCLYFVENDTAPVDGYPESITFRYKVYTAGTNTLLYATPAKTFATPAIPVGCAVNDPNKPFNYDMNLSLLRREDQLNSSTVLVEEAQMELDCWDGSNRQEADRGVVYSANLSGVAAAGNRFMDQDLPGQTNPWT